MAPMRSKPRRQTALLRDLLRRDETAEGRDLLNRLDTTQVAQRSIFRAILVTLGVSGLAAGGLIFVLTAHPELVENERTPLALTVCVLGTGAALLLGSLFKLWLWFRSSIQRAQEESCSFVLQNFSPRSGAVPAKSPAAQVGLVRAPRGPRDERSRKFKPG